MKRGLLVVGCDNYDLPGLQALTGAELDANRIFEELMQPDVGNYDASVSRLLLSPSLGEVDNALSEVLFSFGKLDTFTMFFAGHGAINSVGFYMCLRDTRISQLSSSGFWLGKLFSQISEAGPAQSNIIIDACNSGGTSDLGILPKSITSGDAGSPAITLLAMAARNRTAGEESTGGIGTNGLLDCITGRAFVQESSATLALTEIGQVVAERLKETGQNPVVTSLNVSERSIFCRNPRFLTHARSSLSKWDARAFLDEIEPILAVHSNSANDVIGNLDRLCTPLVTNARDLPDRFKELEVLAASICALLPLCENRPAVDRYSLQLLERLADLIHIRLIEMAERAKEDKRLFLSSNGGFGELFSLPVRLSKVIGWCGASYHLDKLLGQDDSFPRQEFSSLLTSIVNDYPLSISLMSDTQAPYIALGISAASELGLKAQAEEVLSLLFNSALQVKGMIASPHIEPDKILQYLTCRLLEDFSQGLSTVARPSEAITVLLRCGSLLKMDEVFDDALEELDHLNINAYIADNYFGFAKERIEGGENASFAIGHGVWKLADLEAAWPPAEQTRAPSNLVAQGSAMVASLIFPDRVPWFILSAPPTSEAP